MSADHAAPLLRCDGISKHYGGVTAVDDFSMDVYPGEIVALVGDNGAGKSTVVKMLSGALTPDGGTLSVRGQQVSMHSPMEARRAGIETVWQNLAIARDLDAAANMFLGRELVSGRRLSLLAPLRTREMRARATAHLSRLGISLGGNLTAATGQLSGGQAQALAIARAASWATALLILDEPTAALGVKQSQIVTDLCLSLRAQGLALVLVSHDLPRVLEIADRVVVIRHGRKVFDGTEIGHEALVRRIVGLDGPGEA